MTHQVLDAFEHRVRLGRDGELDGYLDAESGSTLGRAPAAGASATDRDHAGSVPDATAFFSGTCGATGPTLDGTSGLGNRAATIASTARVLLPDASRSSSSTLSIVRWFRTA